jgi:Lysyl oxidase
VGSRRLAVVSAAAAAVFACAIATTPTAGAAELLPDLVADAPTNPQLVNYSHPDGTTHLLLRFDGFVHNRGQGALDMRGSQRVDTSMTNTVQRIYQSGGGFVDDASRDPEIIWEPEDGHAHWHLKDAARYSLWNSQKTAEVAPALKVGFCLVDSQRIETHGPTSAQYTVSGGQFCRQNQPTASSVFEGVSAGWRDIYDRTLAFQWVDVTDTQPGTYWLRAEIDPEDFVRESDELNSATYATASSTIPGYAAKPVNAGVVSATGPTSINLATDSFGSGLGTPTFRIIEPPRRGTLNRVSGPTFTGATVVYTPRPGWRGPDRFTYTAQNSSSQFPHYPAVAAVTLNVGGVSPSVAISGAPASLNTGTSARLLAAVTAEDPYVSWTVDGIGGGSSQVGTVDAHGLYVAPAQVPPSGQATIRATTASGAFDDVTIAITNPPPPQPAPMVAAAAEDLLKPSALVQMPEPVPPDPRFPSRLFGIRLATDGVAVIVSARARRAGVVRARVWTGDRLLSRCRTRTPAGRPAICRALLPHGASAAGTRVVLTLRTRGELLDVRRAAIPASAVLPGHPPGHE